LRDGRTVDGEVAERSACGTLHLDVWVLEEEQNRLEGVAIDFSDIWVLVVSLWWT
jgi:hypothetical protein